MGNGEWGVVGLFFVEGVVLNRPGGGVMLALLSFGLLVSTRMFSIRV